MRRIELDMPQGDLMGTSIVWPVQVNWFPGLTKDQILANAFAALDGQPQPYPDPNLIEVIINR